LAQSRTFSLADRAKITLTQDWVERTDTDPPPFPILTASAPRVVFSDFLVLENQKTPAVLKMGFSDNPFFGSNVADLDNRLHNNKGLLRHLFFFFFPPPRPCLAQARTRWTEAQRRYQAELKQEAERKRDKDEQPRTIPPPEPFAMNCEFGPATADFFAQQLSLGFTFGDRVTPALRDFYLPPLYEIDRDGWTWFIFEAQSQRLIDRAELDRFGLAESLQGSKVHYLWAFGARSPFPFIRDPLRKDLQLVQVAAALVSANDDAAARFRELLSAVKLQ
jgi:hypothetical protein